MRVAASSDGKRIAKPKILNTPLAFEQGIKVLKSTIKDLAQGKPITGIGVGIPGPLDKQKSMVINAPNLFGWNNQPLKQKLKESFDAPILLENDAALAGLGEATWGSGKGYQIVAYLTIGTGVGGSRIVNGKIDENALGFEPGHQIIEKGQKTKTLENLISGRAIENLYGQSPEEIIDAKTWDRIALQLALGLNNTLVHWSPHILVLGGGVMRRLPLGLVKKHLRSVCTIFPKLPTVKKAKLEGSSGLWGALSYLQQKL